MTHIKKYEENNILEFKNLFDNKKYLEAAKLVYIRYLTKEEVEIIFNYINEQDEDIKSKWENSFKFVTGSFS